jgi:hypothetical protein
VQHVGAADLDRDVGEVLRLTPLPVGLYNHHGAFSLPIDRLTKHMILYFPYRSAVS